MTLIDTTFKDTAWYWTPSQGTGPDGVPVFDPPVILKGRWDDNPVMVVGPQGEQYQINVRFTTRTALVAGGWLLRAGDEGSGDPESGAKPNAFPLAREIRTVTTVKNFQRTATYYTGMLK